MTPKPLSQHPDQQGEERQGSEYRICWAASSNISFRGATDWTEWDGFEETAEDIEEALTTSASGRLVQGLEEALEASGFDWWPEVRATPATPHPA